MIDAKLAGAITATTHATSIDSAATRYRWVCACGASGIWKPREFQARQGATKHVAAKGRR